MYKLCVYYLYIIIDDIKNSNIYDILFVCYMFILSFVFNEFDVCVIFVDFEVIYLY